ncbi:tumor necrosis factor receptor superfamily member 6 isoform X2 [Bombina bombina]|uniref:tumor necrosis factor receptor superfamily member 6 isoform X2 n=1 Tax=Bombina bombina TaxID=8345 RepID=UPI00235AE835|nr:tumor necrosis factor receptor superfamily member 6 isoform X2 [Bombina bombina]
MAVIFRIVVGLLITVVVSGSLLLNEKTKPIELLKRSITCKDNEYLHNNVCCRKCPAGTHVAEHCYKHGSQGVCERCIAGEGFTEYPNGENFCFTCKMCRDDEDTVRECTQKTNTICTCKPGRYCHPGEPCEMCNICTSCGAGQRMLHPCNATSNTVCEDGLTSTQKAPKDATVDTEAKDKGTSGGKGTCGNHDAGSPDTLSVVTTEEEQDQLLNGPIPSSVTETAVEHPQNSADPPNRDLTDIVIDDDNVHKIFYAFINAVPSKDWPEFARYIGLKQQDFDSISYHNNPRDEKYQLLYKWRAHNGRHANIKILFNALEKMKLESCKENVINELSS